VNVSILRVTSSDCGQAVPGETLERLAEEEEINVHCSACGNPIVNSLWNVVNLYNMESGNNRNKAIVEAQLTGDT